MSAGARFRTALDAEQPLQIVGTINAYTALLARQAGYKAIYLSGAGVANASHGLPDLAMTTLNDVCEDIRRIASAYGVFAGAAEARDQIRIVGSSTVYPFATVVAEQFVAGFEEVAVVGHRPGHRVRGSGHLDGLRTRRGRGRGAGRQLDRLPASGDQRRARTRGRG